MNMNLNSKVTIFERTCDKPLCIEANDNFCGSGTSQSAVSWNSTYGNYVTSWSQATPTLKTDHSTLRLEHVSNIAIGARFNDECGTTIGPPTVEDPVSVLGSTIGATANDISCDVFVNESNSVVSGSGDGRRNNG